MRCDDGGEVVHINLRSGPLHLKGRPFSQNSYGWGRVGECGNWDRKWEWQVGLDVTRVASH
eukprot:10919232-Alexandrium_andersonii.AAC.1